MQHPTWFFPHFHTVQDKSRIRYLLELHEHNIGHWILLGSDPNQLRVRLHHRLFERINFQYPIRVTAWRVQLDWPDRNFLTKMDRKLFEGYRTRLGHTVGGMAQQAGQIPSGMVPCRFLPKKYRDSENPWAHFSCNRCNQSGMLFGGDTRLVAQRARWDQILIRSPGLIGVNPQERTLAQVGSATHMVTNGGWSHGAHLDLIDPTRTRPEDVMLTLRADPDPDLQIKATSLVEREQARLDKYRGEKESRRIQEVQERDLKEKQESLTRVAQFETLLGQLGI